LATQVSGIPQFLNEPFAQPVTIASFCTETTKHYTNSNEFEAGHVPAPTKGALFEEGRKAIPGPEESFLFCANVGFSF